MVHNLRGWDKPWETDAENGFLSHQKMIHVTNQRHVKQLVTDVERETSIKRRKSSKAFAVYKNFPTCSTNTGWFVDWCCMSRESDIESNLGLGISIYFK